MLQRICCKGTKHLSKIFQRYNSIILKPKNFEDASKVDEFNQAMKEEITAIENKTWQLVDKPKDKKSLALNGSIGFI